MIAAKLGTVALGAGEAITLEMGGGGLIEMKVERSSVDALIANQHLVEAPDGRVLMSARAAGQLAAGVINNTGEIRADRITEINGVVRLEAGDINNAGLISADVKAGGSITLATGRNTVNTGASKRDTPSAWCRNWLTMAPCSSDPTMRCSSRVALKGV